MSLETIDTRHLGHERVIAAFLTDDGTLVDPGPASALDALLEGLGDVVPERIALTHIHLDHAGATGVLCRRWPEAEVWVHERGAPHLVDPAKLLKSAGRLYGEEHMERLWGEVAPVPAERVRALAGGEALDGWQVAYAPGHASHHVAYLHEADGTAFTGDAFGVRIPPDGPVLPPTPPPEVDVPSWRGTLERIAGWRPARLALTHFGVWDAIDEQLEAMRAGLDDLPRLAALDHDAFIAAARGRLPAEVRDPYERAMPSEHLWLGLQRARERELL